MKDWLPELVDMKMPEDGVELETRAGRLAATIIRADTIDPHWSTSARSLVECLILYVCSEPGEQRSLAAHPPRPALSRSPRLKS